MIDKFMSLTLSPLQILQGKGPINKDQQGSSYTLNLDAQVSVPLIHFLKGITKY